MISIASLGACSLFDDTDPREGVETVEACAARLAEKERDDLFEAIADNSGLFVPTYTYDITKASLEDLQNLTVPGSDETAGSRNMAATNETSTAVDQFMAQSVDEKGAFFMGLDPALYRVRGEAAPLDEIVSQGCERQKQGMRLIAFSADVSTQAPATTELTEEAPE